jgi:hypothetical protein
VNLRTLLRTPLLPFTLMNNASGLCAEPINPSLINHHSLHHRELPIKCKLEEEKRRGKPLDTAEGVALPPLEAYGATVTCKSGGCGRVMAHLKKGQ